MPSKQKKTWYNIKNQEKSIEVLVYGEIGFWGVTALDFIQELNDVSDGTEALDIRLSSPGGSVFEGIDIYSELRRRSLRGQKINVSIDSMAASIASVIAMAGDTISISSLGRVMIHKPWSFSIGTAENFREDAELLDSIEETIIDSYLKRKKVRDKFSREELAQKMEKDFWMNAEEAVENGFADSIFDQEEDAEDPVENVLQEVANKITNKDFTQYFEDTEFDDRCIKALNMSRSKILNRLSEEMGHNLKTPKGGNMPDKKATGGPENNNQAVENKEVQDLAKVRAEERARIAGIENLCSRFSVSAEVKKELINDENCTVEKASNRILDEISSKNVSLSPETRATVEADEVDKVRNATVNAFLGRSGVKQGKEVNDALSSEVPNTLHGHMRNSLIRSGMSATKVLNMNADSLASEFIRHTKNAVSIGTGDLSSGVLEDTINKSLGIGFNREGLSTWRSWVTVKSVNDFRDYSHAKLSNFSQIETILEGQAPKYGTMQDKKETGSISTKGRNAGVSRPALVNDDLSSLTEVPVAMGAAVAFQQNYDVYSTLNSNPTMNEDSTALFHSNHNNLAGSAGAPSKAAFDTARQAFREQTAPKGDADSVARRLNLVPRFVIAGPKHESAIEKLLFSQYDTSSAGSLAVNPYGTGGRTSVTPIIDATLGSLDADAWYMATDSMLMDHMVFLALNGRVEPFVRSSEATIDQPLGIYFSIYADYGVMVGEWRGLYKNAGN